MVKRATAQPGEVAGDSPLENAIQKTEIKLYEELGNLSKSDQVLFINHLSKLTDQIEASYHDK